MPATTLTVTSDAGASLQDFLASRLDLSRNRAKALIDAKSVLVNRHRVWMARHTVERGDIVEVTGTQSAPVHGAIPILLEDRDFLVVNKPAGILSNGPDSAESRLREERGEPALRAAHRLDKDTSGCLLIARSNAAFDQAVAVFRERDVGKIYLAIVAGRTDARERNITFPLDGLSAMTRIRTISSNKEASYLDVAIETGRTHQIRRHLAMVGHPVLGDRQYGTRMAIPDRQLTIPRQMLHAHGLTFRPRADDRALHAQAPLPADFKACLAQFMLGTPEGRQA